VTVEKIVADLNEQLTAFDAEDDGPDLRGKVVRLAEILKATRRLNVEVLRTEGITARAGRERIRLYMVRYVGVSLDAIELEVVSGISDYGRRIRELRVEEGYAIISGPQDEEETGLSLQRNQYMLLRPEPDLTAARRWHIANKIRREPGGSQDRMLRYLQANVGQIVTTEELAYVGKAIAFARRVRELRTEQGYAVATRFTGRPDLRPGEYVLEVAERVGEPHDRNIPRAVEEAVYQRDHNTCRICGWDRSQWAKQDPRFLEIHHVEHHANRGPNIPANLLVICNRCHDNIHAGRVVPPDPE
jgi:hypothetical protein